MELGVLCGLASEARILRRAADASGAKLDIACSAARAAMAAEHAERLASKDLDACVSFGLAGALDPALGAGQAVIPRRVLSPGGEALEADAELRARLLQAVEDTALAIADADVAGVDAAADSVEAKRALAARTGCGIVDMESHALAAACHRHKRRFLVLRAVADTSGMAVPKGALAAVDEHGHARPGPVLADVLRRPGRLPDYLALMRAHRDGLAGLEGAARALCAFSLGSAAS
ncbi:MAG: hypothetical protein R3316_04570 [Rhodovibrionaceae bacterium]|nr:hypothetical protein [Rhodovibrionaceae bacterium]